MNINIWIKTEEAISGNITKYYETEPVANLKDPDKYRTEYVQVQVTQDEYTALVDGKRDIWSEALELTSGEFENWYNKLTDSEKQEYKNKLIPLQENKRDRIKNISEIQ